MAQFHPAPTSTGKVFFLHLMLFLLFSGTLQAQDDAHVSTLFTGFRASGILENYPNHQFPSASYWNKTGKTIASKFAGGSPAGIWIVSTYWENGDIGVNFPSGGSSIPHITFSSADANEAYLRVFDTSGVKVWLQVEPGAASMDTLISIVLNRYKQHPCVIGFGVDVEWYQANLYPGDGKKVTDGEAQRWEQKVKAVDSSYTLFLKHYAQGWMPPTYRGQILFVDDSQEFSSLTQMVNEFKSWGAKFAPAKSAFQFGYPVDSVWWKNYSDPMRTIGNALLAIPTCTGLFWVDFTINKLFPITSVQHDIIEKTELYLGQNYPNPFNPETSIAYVLEEDSFVDLSVYNVLGKKVCTLVQQLQKKGEHHCTVHGAGLASGIYFYRLQSGKTLITKQMLLIK